jgi:hypothetical protein
MCGNALDEKILISISPFSHLRVLGSSTNNLEQKGYLRSPVEQNGRQSRRLYRATPLGRRALKAAKVKVSELFVELFAAQ